MVNATRVLEQLRPPQILAINILTAVSVIPLAHNSILPATNIALISDRLRTELRYHPANMQEMVTTAGITVECAMQILVHQPEPDAL